MLSGLILTTIQSIIKLLNSCPRLTHLSLTGVQAFLRQDLEQFCRDAPPGKLLYYSAFDVASARFADQLRALQSSQTISGMCSASSLAKACPIYAATSIPTRRSLTSATGHRQDSHATLKWQPTTHLMHIQGMPTLMQASTSKKGTWLTTTTDSMMGRRWLSTQHLWLGRIPVLPVQASTPA